MKKSFMRLSHFQRSRSILSESSSASINSSPDSPGHMALNELKKLFEQKKYTEILERIPSIEKEFPGCAKALIHYRGLAKYEILKESGDLPELTHMKQ